MQYPLIALLLSQPLARSRGPSGAVDWDGASVGAPSGAASEQGQAHG